MSLMFETVLGMSLIGCYSILVVLFVRVCFLRPLRCPRKFAYYLWFVVFLNLCIPVSVKSPFSLVPEPLQNAAFQREPETGERVHVLQDEDFGETPAEGKAGGVGETDAGESTAAAEEGQLSIEGQETGQQESGFWETAGGTWKAKAAVLWGSGVLILLTVQAVLTFRVRRLITKNSCVKEDARRRIRELSGLPAPFVWGIFRPVICLPAGLERRERIYILAHEECHRKRGDSLVKCVLLLVSILHWFNPLVWMAYALCCKDMEMSCDEAVLAGTAGDIRKEYASSLLKYAARQNGYLLTPLTFGEPSVKSRIKNVLYYKRRPVLISAAAFLCVLIAAAGLSLRPENAQQEQDSREDGTLGQGGEEQQVDEKPEQSMEEAEQERYTVLNNGGQVIQVGGELYYKDGQALYSDGRQLYLSAGEQESDSSVYRHELDGSGFKLLTDGRILASSEDGTKLWYEKTQPSVQTKELWEYDTLTDRETLLCSGFSEWLGFCEDTLYVSEAVENGLQIDELKKTQGEWELRRNILERTFSEGSRIPCFYADEEGAVFAAGIYEGSGAYFSGSFYSWDKETGRIEQKHLTDSDTFLFFDGAIYYEKYSHVGSEQTALYRAGRNLTGEEEIKAERRLVGVNREKNLLYVEADDDTGEIFAENDADYEGPATVQKLMSIRPDGSDERPVIFMTYALGMRSAGELSYSQKQILDWWQDGEGSFRQGDRIQYEDINLLGDTMYLRAGLWGYREGVSIGFRNTLVEECWLKVDLIHATAEVWDPLAQTKAASAEADLREFSTVKELENAGWDPENSRDVRQTFSQLSPAPTPEEEAMTYLVAQTENYTLYGKGDYQSLLFGYRGGYTEFPVPYTSNYMIQPEVREQDFDGDGVSELCVIVCYKHGTGVYVESLYMADPKDAGETAALSVCEFTQEEATAQIEEHITSQRTEQGLAVSMDGREVWPIPADPLPYRWSEAKAGEQIRYAYEEDGVTLTADLGLVSDDEARSPLDYTQSMILKARVVYSPEGSFALTQFTVYHPLP